MNKIAILGDGLDSLIISDLKLKKGHVVYLISETNNLGGHFSGFRNHDKTFDIGMVLFEPNNYQMSQKKLVKYTGENAQNLRSYVDDIYFNLESNYGELKNHKIYTKSKNYKLNKDFFISDKLDLLNNLTKNDKDLIMKDLISNIIKINNNPDMHPSKKITSSFFKTKNLREGLIELYGLEFYNQIFKNYLESVVGRDFDFDLIKLIDHRKLWIPLYYPETLYNFLIETESNMNFYPRFKLFKNKSISTWVSEMKNNCLANDNFKFIDYNDLNEIQFYIDELYIIKKVKSKARISENNEVKKILSKESIDITCVHFCVDESDPKTIIFSNPENSLYRMTIMENSSCDYTVLYEFGSDAIKNEQEILSYANSLNIKYGLKRKCKGHLLRSKIHFHNKETRKSMSEQSNLVIDKKLKIKIFDYSNYLGNSLNENLGRAFGLLRHSEGN